MSTPEELRASATLAPDFADFLSKNGGQLLLPPFDPVDSRKWTAITEDAQVASLGPLEPELEELSVDVPLRDGTTSRTLIMRPSAAANKPRGPLIVLYYGGGWCVGRPEQNAPYVRGFARLFGATVVSPSYRVAPEYKFPTAGEDAWEVLRWAAANAEGDLLRSDPVGKGFIVGGGSAGANISSVVTRRSVEEEMTPKVTGLWVSMLMIFHPSGVSVPDRYRHLWFSFEQNKNAHVLTTQLALDCYDRYEPDPNDPMVCPVVSRDKDGNEGAFDLGRMPRTYIHAGGADSLRDDSTVFYHALKDAGVDVKYNLTPGHSHGTWQFTPWLESSKRIVLQAAVNVAWLLNTTVDEEDVPNKLWQPPQGEFNR